jgi:hypothetical protein
MNLSIEDAKLLLGGISAVVIPFIIAWLPTIKLPDYVKFAILAALSLVGGFLTAYISGSINFGGSIIATGSVILVAAQAFYYSAFRLLGLERVLFPQQALATEAKEQAKDATPTNISDAKAKDILDPNTPSTLEVSAVVTNK